MSNEFGACANNPNVAIKNDSAEKQIIMDRHCVNGPTPLQASALPPPSSTDIPRTNINVGSTSWNYNPYFGNFYNYYTSQTYDLGDVSHQYGNQKCGAQFPCNYQQPLAPNSVLQCCDPRCQLLSEQSKYPFSQALCSKSHQKPKRSRNYYGGPLDILKPDITSRPPPDYAASKYTPMVPYSTHVNDLNHKYNGQQMPYNMQYQTAVKSSKSLFLSEPTAYNNTDFAKQQCWNKPNLWNPNLSSSCYSTIQQTRSVNHKFPVPLLEQNGMNSAVKHNILHNHSTLESRSTLYDSSYMPSYHYMNNRQNHISNHEHRHMNEECSYSHFPSNSHQFQSTYNAHCSIGDNGQDHCYKELVLKSSETTISKQRTVDKSPNLDVREFLSTWDEGEDDRPPESEAPVIVLDCTSLEGDALAKVKEKLGNTISDCNSLGNSVTTICELESQSNATVLKVVDDAHSTIVLSKPTSVIQDSNSSSSSNGKVGHCAEKSASESSHLISDGFMTWYSNSKKRDEHSYDLVEMTERLVNSVDKLFGEPEKKNMPKPSGLLSNMSCQISNQNMLDENYIGGEWSTDFNGHKRNNSRLSQDIVTNHYSTDTSKYIQVNNLPSNTEKSACHFSVNKVTMKPINNALSSATTVVQDYSIKYKDNYKPCSNYYQTGTTNSSCQYYNSCYYAGTNMNSYNVPGSTGTSGSNVITKNNNLASCVDSGNKNSFGNSDITQIKADLEKSLNEITNDLHNNNQKALNIVLGNAVVSHAPDFPKTCADLGKKILEIGMVTSNLSMKTTCKGIDTVTSHNSVIQKTGESNSTISEITEDSGSCENSLLSMPSLSPPPTSRIPTTSSECTASSVVLKLQTDNIQNKGMGEDKSSISNCEVKSPSKLQENVGNLNQPLNLAIDKDLTKLNDLEISISKVGKAVEDRLVKEVEKKDVPINRSIDLNIGKMDDGYYSIENHFDYDNECYKSVPNSEASSQLKDVKDGKTTHLITHQTCIVSCKLYETKLKEYKNETTMSPSHDSNLKSKSAPPSLVNTSDVFLSEKPKQFKSLEDLQDPIELQSLDKNDAKTLKLDQDTSEIVSNDSSSIDKTVIDSSENPKSHISQPAFAEENDHTTSVVVIAHQEMNPAHGSMEVPTSTVPIETQSIHSTDNKIKLLDETMNASEACIKSTPNVCNISCKPNEIDLAKSQSIRPGDPSSHHISINEETVSSNSRNNVETSALRDSNKMNGCLDDLSQNNMLVNHGTAVPSTHPDSVSRVETSLPQITENGNVHNSSKSSSPVNYNSKCLPIEEKQQELTLDQVEDCRPAEDLHRVPVPTSTIAKPLKDSLINEMTKLPASVLFSPTHSSTVTSVHAVQNDTKPSDNDVVKLGNNTTEYKQELEGDIDGKRNHKKKLKYKKHKSKKNHIYIGPYKNPRLLKDDDKLMKKVCGGDSVIKENTNLLNTSHSPLYPIRSVQDLEMKLSNIRQRLPNDTLLYKCVPKDPSPTNCEDQSSKFEEISESSTCQNENELPQNPYNLNNDVVISVVSNICTANESTNSFTFENLTLGKHIFTQKNTDLPMKKRKQDLSIYNSEKQTNSNGHERMYKSKYFADDRIYNHKIKARFNQLKKYKRPKRRFSFTEDPKVLSHKSAGNMIDGGYRRSKSLIDWHEDENYCLDSPNDLHPMLMHQQTYNNLDSVKQVSISNPCISSIQEKELGNSSISLPASPFVNLPVEETPESQCSPLQHSEFLVNSKSLLLNDRAEENNDSLPDTNYYDYNIPSVAPTPQCDLSKEDRFESDLIETCNKPSSPEHDFHLSVTFDNSPVYNAPSTPNCDFLANEGVNEDFTNCVQSANEIALSECNFNEDSEKISSKAPSPCCMFNDVIIDEISDQNLYQPLKTLSPASSVAPSPQCDIIDGVILDNQDSGENIIECDDNNNHHADSVDCLEPPSRVLCGVPTLQSLAFEALDGISTEPSSSNSHNSNNVLELWVTPGETEIIIHSEDQQATDMDEYVEASDLYHEAPITSDPSMNEIVTGSIAELPHTGHSDVENEDEQCQCVIISNDESVTLVLHKNDLVEDSDPMIDNTYINGCSVDDEFQFSNNCIEESFIDQELRCSPSTDSLIENQVYDDSSLVEMTSETTTYASALQIKVQLPWYKIFNLSDDLNNYDVGLLKELELGPAQIEVRLSSSGSKLWKVVNSKPEFLSSVLKVKRLVLQPAPAVNDDENNDDVAFSNDVESSAGLHEENLEVADSALNNSARDNHVERRQFRRGSRSSARKKLSKANSVNGIVGVPKMVIRKTSCREYRSYLRDSDFLLPTVRLNRYKRVDELALKMNTGNSGGGSININDLSEITSPKRKSSKTDVQPASMRAEGNLPYLMNGVTGNNEADGFSSMSRLENVEICKKLKDTAVGVGSVLFPKPSPERHHCLLCHRTYSSEELYQSHVKSKLHRHLELTQRKTIHAMYRYFTGHLCPRLRPLSAKERKKMKWKPRKANVHHFYHQKTPLQIALHKSVFHHRK